MQQPERPAQVDERREEEHAQRDPHVRRVQLAPEGARVAARHRPGHLVAGPLLERSPPLRSSTCTWTTSLAVRGRSSPASGRRPSCTRSGGAARRAAPRAPCRPRAAIRSTSRALCSKKRGGCGLRRRPRRGPPREPLAGQPRSGQRGRDDQRRAAQSRDSSMRKLHILFPMKLSGVAATIEIACAGSSATPATLTSSSRIARGEHERRDADGEEAGRLEAGVPAARAEGPVAVPPEVVEHGDREGGGGRHEVVEVEQLHAQRRTRTGSRRSPTRRPRRTSSAAASCAACAARRARRRCIACGRLGDRRSRLVGHAANGTPKCSSTNGVTSARDHCSRSGASTPQRSSTPSESSRWSEPWLPPPTWSAPPQSTNS